MIYGVIHTLSASDGTQAGLAMIHANGGNSTAGVFKALNRDNQVDTLASPVVGTLITFRNRPNNGCRTGGVGSWCPWWRWHGAMAIMEAFGEVMQHRVTAGVTTTMHTKGATKGTNEAHFIAVGDKVTSEHAQTMFGIASALAEMLAEYGSREVTTMVGVGCRTTTMASTAASNVRKCRHEGRCSCAGHRMTAGRPTPDKAYGLTHLSSSPALVRGVGDASGFSMTTLYLVMYGTLADVTATTCPGASIIDTNSRNFIPSRHLGASYARRIHMGDTVDRMGMV